ncbi:Signal transduction histidine kinase [Spirosomataceae bacterium TFI 002]|nr:Signal transduction histidine kinase [Spirosomataceae bacterium TFI 002]
MRNKTRYIAFLFLFWTVSTFAQQITPENAIVSRENWLPNRTINAIFQDSEGLLWVGTTNGLYQYNGKNVKHFTTKPNKQNAIFTNLVNDIGEDADGNIIVALESGLSSYNKGQVKFLTLSPKVEHYGRVWQDDYKRVWIGVDRANAFVYSKIENGDSFKFDHKLSIEQFEKDSPVAIKDFELLSKNQLLVAANNGLFRADLAINKVFDLGLKYSVSVIRKLVRNEYLVGTNDNGLLHLRIDKSGMSQLGQYHFGKANEVGHDRITSISVGQYGEILVSTAKNLYQGIKTSSGFSFSTLINDDQILQDNNIRTTYIDQSGIYWIGTLRGLYKIRPGLLAVERLRIETPNYNPLNQNVNFLFKENENKFWLGTTDDGFFTVDPTTEKFSKVQFDKNIARVYQSSKGYFIGLNTKSVFNFGSSEKPDLKLVSTSNQDMTTAIEVAPGEWWIGCNKRGLISYDDDGIELYVDLLHEANKFTNNVSTIFTIIKDSRQNVWVGSKGDGLLRINLATGEIKKYSGINVNSEISRRILHIKETSDGMIWIGTREGGLYKYDHVNDSFAQFTTAHGLPSNVICAVAEDEHKNIVISTNNGLALYNENGLVPFRSYGEQDGVIFGDFSFNAVIEGKDNCLFFGNSNGLYKIKKREAAPSQQSKFHWNAVKPIASEVSKIFSESKNYLEGWGATDQIIELAPADNNFEVSFALLNFSDPEKNAYAYRMKGHIEEWTYILNREQSVKLLDIPYGEYLFEMKAEDSFGTPMAETQALRLRVLPPFWLSPIAFIIYFMLFVALLVVAYYLIKRWNQLQQKLKEEEALVEIKDQQMVYFADLSHEIKNRLSLILGPLENALSGKKVNQAVLNNIYQQTFKLKRISDQIMDLRKSEGGQFLLQVEKGDVFESLEKLCLETQPLAIVRNITLNYELEEEADEAWYDEELLEIITLNLLNNAIKYTPSGGTVNVKAKTVFLEKSDLPDMAPSEGLYLKCKISDTGIGIPKNDVKNLFNRFYRASNARKNLKVKGAGIGLSLVGRLIKKHRGFIDINSEEGDGTRVNFYLPLEKNHFQLNEIKLSGSEIPIIEGILPEYSPLDNTRSTVLLADDNEEILSFLDEHLSLEFNVVKTSNGSQAWEYLQENAVDLVVSDLSMPEMDGLELMRRLKEHETLKHIPFIILTGRNSHSQKLACIQNGVDDFVDKPFSLELITWRIKGLLFNRNLMKSSFSRKVNVEPTIEYSISPDEQFIQQVVGLIDEHIQSKNLSVEFLAEQCNMSRATFYRKMENLMGSAPSTFIRKYRLKKAIKLLKSGNYYISEVAYQTGFSTPKYFTKCFQKEFGSSPTDYVKSLTDLFKN